MAESCVLSPSLQELSYWTLKWTGSKPANYIIFAIFFGPQHQYPKIMNIRPHYFDNIFRINRNSLPRQERQACHNNKGKYHTWKTFFRSYLADKAITVSCVLSPSSASAIRPNVVKRGHQFHIYLLQNTFYPIILNFFLLLFAVNNKYFCML